MSSLIDFYNILVFVNKLKFLPLVPPPMVEPMRKYVTSGNSVTFIVSSNLTSAAFQWQFNGANITEGQQSNLTISDVKDKDEGNYTCIVSTMFGVDITSNTAQLFVCEFAY